MLLHTYDKFKLNETLTEETILEFDITILTIFLGFAIGISKQFKLVKDIQSNVLQEKVDLLSD